MSYALHEHNGIAGQRQSTWSRRFLYGYLSVMLGCGEGGSYEGVPGILFGSRI